MKKMIYTVEGITCGGCVKKLNGKFEGNTAITKIEVSEDKKKVSISGEDTLSGMDLKAQIEDLGFEVLGFEKA